MALLGLVFIFMMPVFAKPASCASIKISSAGFNSVLVSTMHVFSFVPSNVSNGVYFNAYSNTNGATFSYLVGTPDAVHDFMNGILADVTGKLNVTRCSVSLTGDDIAENKCIYILNDGLTHGIINISYYFNNISSTGNYLIDVFSLLYPLVENAGIFAGGALIVLGITCKLYERRNMKAGEVHG